MSNSRLEKFIYAICSMDVSDLPVPLSRIEKLWNCLITGETPDFEPLSRNEKYLMAMLDRYDISNLPAPVSRGEKLLYKIAVGETDLSDVPDYLSRYEELLKYLIENGGISGGDFEYVLYTINQSLYTLYTTAEKPVKSAILTGNTLVNLLQNTYISDGAIKNGNVFYSKVDTTYTLIYNVTALPTTTTRSTFMVNLSNGTTIYQSTSTTVKHKIGINKWVFKTPTDGTFNTIGYWSNNEDIKLCANNIVLLEGDYTQENIPYFEGMQSVKMPVLTTTGKNLFDKTKFLRGYYVNELTGVLMGSGNNGSYSLTDFIEIQPNKTLTNNNAQKKTRYAFYDKNKTFISGGIDEQIISPPNARYLRWTFTIDSEESYQIEYGSIRTSYEPYKSNILRTSEDVVLKGIGEVQDTLNCLTGEVVQNIGEIVLDGSENWRADGGNELYSRFIYSISDVRTKWYKVLSDKFIGAEINSLDGEKIYRNGYGRVNGIVISNNKLENLTVDGLKAYLMTNPVTVQYELEESIVKTVDLTTVDQNNQPTQLGTFENVTHVSLESAGLIPEVEMEVATRISKELESASPLMDELSTKQQQLEATVNEQSENVDATMIATTEIYEETL